MNNSEVETTDSWPLGKIIKHIILPKPKGSPKAGKKEIIGRVVIGVFFLTLALSRTLFSNTSLPDCDSSDTNTLVGQIINDMPLAKASGAQFVSLKNIEEQGFNQDVQLRSCTATLVTSVGEDNLQYSVKWSNKEAGEFYVEARIQ